MPNLVKGPNWIKPVVSTERGEFERTANSFGLNTVDMMVAADKGQLIDWPFSAWNTLENTDSFETGTETAADSLARSYGRDTTSIKHAFRTGGDLPAPIIWQRLDGSYYLVAGNTRLMIARALDRRPKVLLFRY